MQLPMGDLMRNVTRAITIILSASLLSGCWLSGDDAEALQEALAGGCNLEEVKAYIGEIGGENVPGGDIEGALIIDDECEGIFISANIVYGDLAVSAQDGYAFGAYTGTYSEVAPSTLYSEVDWVNLLKEYDFFICEILSNRCNSDSDSIDEIIGPVLSGTGIQWYELSYDSQPVLPILELSNPEAQLAHIMFQGEEDETGSDSVMFELDLDALSSEEDITLDDAVVGGGQFFSPPVFEEEPEELLTLEDLSDSIWFSNTGPASIEFFEDGTLAGGDIAQCTYSGTVSETGKTLLDSTVFDISISITCNEYIDQAVARDVSGVDYGTFTGVLYATDFQATLVAKNGEKMVVAGLYDGP